MDTVDMLNEGATGRSITVDRFLQLPFEKSEIRSFFDPGTGVMRVYRVETRKCPDTGLALTCKFPLLERAGVVDRPAAPVREVQ